MTGRDTGFWGCFKREVPQCSFIHCMLHKQALATKNLQPELHETLNLVIKVVNFVKSSLLNERILRKLCEDSEAEHDVLLFHAEIRNISSRQEFSSIYFKLKLGYLTEIFSYYNLSNLRLQGDGIFLQVAIENVTTFQNQLKFFRLRILSNQWNMFSRVEAILSPSPHLEVKFTPLVEEHLMNLVTDFSNRFSDVPSIPKYLLTPMDKSLEDMMDLGNILVEELLYLQGNEEAKAKYSCANKSKFWFLVKGIAPNLFKKAERLLLHPFPTIYFCEKRFLQQIFLGQNTAGDLTSEKI
ncbi:SCAN domain-containing protein 3-like [Oopsacas minuta]|uniref:SCAN domain-containing protein 3-like n=1 Tax=Oopsacas minuta TaxID=111878 RepID=A0AAV7K4K0_9METZ|nr:SCAN domain-containing protein 3-like [Oopsacas minuta]